MKKLAMRTLVGVLFSVFCFTVYVWNIKWIDEMIGPFEQCHFLDANKTMSLDECNKLVGMAQQMTAMRTNVAAISPWGRYNIRKSLLNECKEVCREDSGCGIYSYSIAEVYGNNVYYEGVCRIYMRLDP